MDRIPSVLACDVGNSTIDFAHVRGEEVTGRRTIRIGNFAGLGKELAELWRSMPTLKKSVAASVNPAGLKALEAAVEESLGVELAVIGRSLPLPIETNLEQPASVGVDRLCCAAAAFDRIGTACVVGDFGTAITIDCVDDKGVFLGGAILPGLQMGAESLQTHTAQLPSVELTDPKWTFGKDTHQAIVGGLIFGARGALQGIVEAYATELGHWPVVILTGGDAGLICPEPNASGLVQAVVPDLALRGVAIAHYKTLLD